MKKGHTIKCLKNHLKKKAKYIANEGEKIKEEMNSDYLMKGWMMGRADAYLRVIDMLNGDITGDDCVFDECICKKKRVLKNSGKYKFVLYDHYSI
jgi:predicted aconitase